MKFYHRQDTVSIWRLGNTSSVLNIVTMKDIYIYIGHNCD